MIFVCSKICGGKSVFSKKLAEDLRFDFLEVSDLVKKFLNTQNREKLQGHPELDKRIISHIGNLSDNTVVCGVRQTSILKAFPDSDLIWLEVSKSIRKDRFKQRRDFKDKNVSFEDAEEKDVLLGIEDVKNYIIKNKGRTIVL